MERRSQGRPRGARTVARATVAAVPPQCPTCGRTIPHLGRTVRRRAVPCGQAPTGQPANRVRVRHTICPCGQPLAIREYCLEPA